jgi:hypothetical protein
MWLRQRKIMSLLLQFQPLYFGLLYEAQNKKLAHFDAAPATAPTPEMKGFDLI